jgi:uncharacterized DUF497 family protein
VGILAAMEFEWDPRKSELNRRKHGITFEEALTVFADPLARVFDDPHHSGEELRQIIVGHSKRHRVVMVYFTERRDRVRIIGARNTTKQERFDYEENKKSE